MPTLVAPKIASSSQLSGLTLDEFRITGKTSSFWLIRAFLWPASFAVFFTIGMPPPRSDAPFGAETTAAITKTSQTRRLGGWRRARYLE